MAANQENEENQQTGLDVRNIMIGLLVLFIICVFFYIIYKLTRSSNNNRIPMNYPTRWDASIPNSNYYPTKDWNTKNNWNVKI